MYPKSEGMRKTAAMSLYRSLTDMMEDAVVLVDEDGNIVAFNRAAHEGLGYTREEFEGMRVTDVDVLMSEELVLERIRQVLPDRGPITYLTKCRRKDGGVVDQQVTARAIDVGERPLVLAVWEDVTDLLAAKETAERAVRLQAEFMQNVAHELRTPLSLIKGYSVLLQQGDMGKLTAGQQSAVNIIQRRAQMLTDMVNSIIIVLEVGHKGETLALEFKPVNLSLLARQLAGDFRLLAEQAGVTLTFTADPLCTVSGDADMLQQTIDNLVRNAIKFTPKGGLVFLGVRREGDRAIVEVRDTGIGIAPEHHERVFERFFQVDASDTRQHGGSGLGLAVVKEVAEAHDGSVSVESEPGKGSTFRLAIPFLEVRHHELEKV